MACPIATAHHQQLTNQLEYLQIELGLLRQYGEAINQKIDRIEKHLASIAAGINKPSCGHRAPPDLV